MSQQNLKHGMLATLIAVSVTLLLLMLGYSGSGIAQTAPPIESRSSSTRVPTSVNSS